MAARGKTGLSKVSRYWPGKAPEWATAVNDGKVSTLEDKHVVEGDSSSSSSLRSSYWRRRRVRQQPEIVSTVAMDRESEEEEDDDAKEERRGRIRARALLLRKQEEEQLLLHHQQLEEEQQHQQQQEEEESEYDETDSDSDDEPPIMVDADAAVPLFIPKSQRDTIGLKEEELQQRQLEEELNKKRLGDRKVQTRQILLEEIKKDELLIGNTAPNEEATNCVDTDDEANQAEEYESWQRRELARIKRSREESGIDKKATEDNNQSNVADRPKKKIKKQMRFMQRYYHKGCFFQGDADDATQTAGTCEIYRLDFSGPTGLDKMDMGILPKIMQVKHFGRRHGTK